MAKEKIICDTDVMVDFFDHAQPRHTETKTLLEQNIGIDNTLISSITKMELILGATNKPDLLAIEKKLNRFNTILLTPDINLQAIRLLQVYRLSHGLALADALIAATGLETGLKLFTYNIRDFKFIKDVVLYKK